jgi:hypothetical protein
MGRGRICVYILVCLTCLRIAGTQQGPFLSQATYNNLADGISGAIACDNLRSLVMYHAHSGGALGILSYYSSRANPWTDHPDQAAWTSVSPSKEGELEKPVEYKVSRMRGSPGNFRRVVLRCD